MRNSDRNHRAASRLAAAAAALLCLTAAAWAQEPTLEQRLREALRKTTGDLRALQEQSDARDAEIARDRGQIAALTQQLAELTARLETARATVAAAPPPKPPDESALAAANARVAALEGQLAAAAALKARVSEAQARATASDKATAETRGLVAACRDSNAQLAAVAMRILDTYKSESFRSVWLRSYEPVLGLARVELENIMQDFEDKLRAQRLPPVP